ncbi:glycoside hydrolase family 43 [Lecanosticta acicola]|uniref:Glycoside hydrolase family 43 n=1 Tax=Lecanosticta acicola TaxID=111012 RepID=A0AAI8Z704_9PEZI|nr:glycoside hydrolase family 43 [Lecanosticta acicola]
MNQPPFTPPDMTFFQRYFTKPRLVTTTTPTSASLPKDQEKNCPPDQAEQQEYRTFSFLSLGSLVLLPIMLIILFGVIATVVAVTLDRDHHARVSGDGDGNVILPQHHNSPIRRAIPSNFPDPAILYANGTWYAFATNNAAGVLAQGKSDAAEYTVDYGRANVQMATSSDFLDWTLASLADQPLSTTGDWTHNVEDGKIVVPHVSFTWAPAVIQRDDGKYVMYYADRPKGQSPYRHWDNPHHPFPHCIGAAVSETNSPAGPYKAQNDSLACPMLEGGAIDPQAIRDINGTIYLTYKIDGNNIGAGGECGNTRGQIVPTPIMLQKLSPDALTPDGDPVEILHNIPTDGPLVEAPMLVRSPDGIYFLFFSSGCTRLNSYTTRYATARQIHGPYLRAPRPLLQTGDWGLVAPGSVGVAQDGRGAFHLALHARVPFGRVGRVRAMFSSSLVLEGETARLVGDNRTVSLEQDRPGWYDWIDGDDKIG